MSTGSSQAPITPTKRDLREQAILDTAERLLGEQGYTAMTIADITNGAEITRGALVLDG